jgi:Mlc titration factor MtfA (ptsG expression regulator)
MTAPGWIVALEIGAIVVLIAAIGTLLVKRSRRQKARRERLARPFSEGEKRVLDRDFPRWRDIPGDLLPRFAGDTRVLMEEKNFEPCGTLTAVSDEMRLIISGQAALTIFGKTDHHYFPRLRSILVYPGAFRDHGRRRFDIPEAEDRGVLYGESWETGSVILSWDNVVAGGRNADDGMNVVIHEFAHQLDQYNGIADGIPQLPDRAAYARWGAVMGPEYDALVAASADRSGPGPFLDPYGATHPAEFFAVASETFFEEPWDLVEEHPELYEELAKFYGLDPASW